MKKALFFVALTLFRLLSSNHSWANFKNPVTGYLTSNLLYEVTSSPNANVCLESTPPLSRDLNLCKDMPQTIEDLASITAKLIPIIESSLINKTIHVDEAGSGVFSGAVDWHSSVLGNWSLLSMSRITKNEKLKESVIKSLSLDDLEKELKFLKANPDFEVPYGRIWLIHLMNELKQADKKYEKIANEFIEDSTELTISWLENNSNNPRMLWVGSYRSPLGSIYFLNKTKLPPKFENRFSKIKDGITKLNFLDGYIFIPGNFLDVEGLWSMVRNGDKKECPSAEEIILRVERLESVRVVDGHTLGATLSSLWPCAEKSFNKDKASCEAYMQLISELLNRPKLWKEDFLNVSHWVPQYIWITLWIGQGSP